MMDLDELRSVQSRERQTDSLQQLRESFYQDAGEFIQQLHRERDRAADQADDPWNAPEVGRLTDDIDTAEQTVEAIYERRVGKIVKMASLAAADMPTEDEGLTEEEQALFDTLVEAIETNRARVEAVVDGDDPVAAAADVGTDSETTAGPPVETDADESTQSSSVDSPDPFDDSSPEDDDPDPSDGPADSKAGSDTGQTPPPEPDEPPAGVDAADLMGGDGPGDEGSADSAPADEATDAETRPDANPDGNVDASADAGSTREADPDRDADHEGDAGADDGQPADDDGPAVERTTVRITRDVGEIFGVDQRAYDLTAEDVVTLPEANAGPLVERDAAERLD